MLRSAVSKALWVGRATSAVVGLALVLALLFGVATAAFGANGGNFVLGETNVATLVTRLAGPAGVNGAMFEVQNNDAGTNDTALSLKVQPGEAPMTVNRATKVTNLNADQLDGLNSNDFQGKYAQTVVVKSGGVYLRRRSYLPVGRGTEQAQPCGSLPVLCRERAGTLTSWVRPLTGPQWPAPAWAREHRCTI
jgi:hypothetical protein